MPMNVENGMIDFYFDFMSPFAYLAQRRLPELAAAVPFYGSQPKTEDVPKIKAAVMIHNASLDKRILEGAAAYEDALKANNKEFESFIYEGANHGFHNDTTPRYDATQANLAWQRTVYFFQAKLS